MKNKYASNNKACPELTSFINFFKQKKIQQNLELVCLLRELKHPKNYTEEEREQKEAEYNGHIQKYLLK